MSEHVDRMAKLEAALKPFADLADEIDFCRGDESPDGWAKMCTWPDLVRARDVLKDPK